VLPHSRYRADQQQPDRNRRRRSRGRQSGHEAASAFADHVPHRPWPTAVRCPSSAWASRTPGAWSAGVPRRPASRRIGCHTILS